MFIVLLLFTFLAQAQSIHHLSENVIDVLSKSNSEVLENEKELSKLEDQNNTSSCLVDNEIEEKCETISSKYLPPDKKTTEHRILFEIQYRPSEFRANSELRTIYKTYLNDINLNRNNIDPKNADEIKNEVDVVMGRLQSNHPDLDRDIVHAAVVFETLKSSNDISPDVDLNAKNAALATQIQQFTKDMSDEGYLKFLSFAAGNVEYSDARATYNQSNPETQGIVTPFEQITGNKNGICGDIHSMISKFGELRGWEAFTVGYALGGSQHVVSGMVNPKDPNKLMIVNYGSYEDVDLNSNSWIDPTPSSDMQDIGMQLRIFKNKDTGSLTGKMQQITTIPTPLGSFLNDVFKNDRHISKSIVNNNYDKRQADIEMVKTTANHKKDGSKITSREVTYGVSIYEGTMDGTQIFGVAVSKDVFKEIYKYDKELKKCVPKKNKYFSLGMSANSLRTPFLEADNNLYAYLNIKGGQIINLYQTDVIQFKGILGYEFEGFAAKTPNYDMGDISADANLTSFFGAVAEYNKKNTAIILGVKVESVVGIKNQNLFTDFSTIKSNVSPLNFNALTLDANLRQKLPNNMLLVSDNKMTYSRSGGRVLLSAGLIKNNTSVLLSYSGTFTPLNIGNSLQEINLLQNMNGQDGLRLNVGQEFRLGRTRAVAGGYVNMSTSTPEPNMSFGGSLKINLNSNKKTKNR